MTRPHRAHAVDTLSTIIHHWYTAVIRAKIAEVDPDNEKGWRWSYATTETTLHAYLRNRHEEHSLHWSTEMMDEGAAIFADDDYGKRMDWVDENIGSVLQEFVDRVLGWEPTPNPDSDWS